MRRWWLQQWNDVKGNVKYGLLAALWWAVIELGKHLLRYIPNIPTWAIWAILLSLSLFMFAWLMRSMKHSVTQQQSQVIQPSSTVVPGIPTLSALLGQEPQITFDAKKFFALAHYSPVTAEIEENIKTIAQQNSPNDKEAFYARFIGIGVVAYQHEVTWFTIYGSQLAALAELNSRGLIPVADLKKHYDKGVVDFPKTYANYSFEQWMDYLQSRMLIARYPSQMVEISFNGKDFLKYLAHVGLNAYGKAN